MLTFMLTCVTCTSYVTSLGWGVGDDVNVHVNLRHMHILRYVTGLGGWGMLTFMLTCVTCTSYVTSLGWRWMSSKTKSAMEVTGRALKDRVAM